MLAVISEKRGGEVRSATSIVESVEAENKVPLGKDSLFAEAPPLIVFFRPGENFLRPPKDEGKFLTCCHIATPLFFEKAEIPHPQMPGGYICNNDSLH